MEKGKNDDGLTVNAFKFIADKCRLSERTVRSAFAKKPVTWDTARKIAVACGIDMREFRIKEDNRGRNKKPRASPK